MVYDVRNHLPQVIEEMRQDIKAGNVEGLESNAMFVSKIIPDFEVIIEKSDQERNGKCIQAWKNYGIAINDVLNGVENKKLEDIAINVSLAQERHIKAFNNAEKDHWETIIANLIRYNHKEYTKLLKEQV